MKYIIVFIPIFFLSCNKSKNAAIDKTILSKETMIALLIDMHLLEASTMQIAATDSLVSPKAYNGYLEIFSKYNTTKQEFEQAIDYYSNHNEQMELIMQAVVDSLTIRNSTQ